MVEKIELDAVYEISQDIVVREIEGELVLVPLAAGIGDMEDDLFSLNETGKAIWNSLDGKKSLTAVAQMLEEKYDSPAGVIEEDVGGLIQELVKRKMVKKVDG
ncbi:MAG: PqqD family protein [Candidatus Aminicenantes bacterium]|nr:PqqD family protein [Candidatus Aminicenantes bacterium]